MIEISGENWQEQLDAQVVEAKPKAWFVELATTIFLSRRTGTHRDNRQVMRLEPGTEVLLTYVDKNPRNRTPLRCAVEGWPEFFWIGANHKVYEREYDPVVPEVVEGATEVTEQ